MRSWRTLLLVGVMVAGTLVLYRPVLGLALIGDDYQWIQHAHHATHDPELLLADLDTFYRPASTWTLAADYLIWGWNPLGFRITNLALHAAAATLLAGCARRAGLGWLAAGLVGVIWATSPFAFEPAASVAIRFENLLHVAWLLLILAWPSRGAAWTRPRLLAAAAAILLAAAAKETWVVTPLLVAALEWSHRKRPLGASVRTAALAAVPVALYTATYFLVFPGDKNYYRGLASTLWKVPHELAAFFHLETLQPLHFAATLTGVLAVVATAGLAAVALRHRSAAGVVGLALLLAPTLPTALVPYLPTRYTTIPYAGFLLLLAGALTLGLRALTPRTARVVGAAAVGLAGLVVTAGVLTVRADISDFARVAAAHRRLVAEARAVAGELPVGRAVLSVRAERTNPLGEVARAPRGLPKLLYPRPQDPYALIDTAALFDCALNRPDRMVQNVPPELVERPAAVLVHVDGGFAWSTASAPSVAAQLERFRSLGLPVTAIRVVDVRAERPPPRAP